MRRDFVESKQQANIAGKRCLYTGIKKPLMATVNAVHEFFVAVVSIYLHHWVIYTHLAWYDATNLRFLYVKKLLIELWKTPLACNVMTTHTLSLEERLLWRKEYHAISTITSC